MAAPRWAGPTGWVPYIALAMEFENSFDWLALLTGLWVTFELEAGLARVTPDLSHHYGCGSASIPQTTKHAVNSIPQDCTLQSVV